MDGNTQAMPREERPIHRYYYSLTTMLFEMHQNKRVEEYYSAVYSCIYSYYQESLALLRANSKLMKITDKQENEFESSYLASRAKVDKVLKSSAEEDKDFLLYQASQLLQEKMHFYEDRDLERNIFAQGAIVQFLSLLESPLHSIYIKLKQMDKAIPDIQDVCKRDRGIVKYLKYFEFGLVNKSNSILVGTRIYQKLRHWINFRNNIVHNNNNITIKLKRAIIQQNLNIGEKKEKFTFNEDNIFAVAGICGENLDILIQQIFRPYFINTCIITGKS